MAQRDSDLHTVSLSRFPDPGQEYNNQYDPARLTSTFLDLPANHSILISYKNSHVHRLESKMQFTLNVLAVLAASASMVAASPPKRYAPAQYRPAQYGNSAVPWTSSTCSAVYSTLTQTSSKPVTTVLTRTVYKPSTWASTVPTVVTSVFTTYKPATTKVVTTITKTYVGKYT
jgi:hypothetical protein